MKKDEQVRLLKLLMQRLDDGTTVDAGRMLKNPTSVYTCPDMAQKEWETFFRDEDYAVAARSQIGANSGLQDHLIFGRNEPALHHYHNTYRAALGMEPLEVYNG